MTRTRTTKKPAKKPNRNKKPNQYYVCGRCNGHFVNLGDFTDHVDAQSCVQVDVILGALKHLVLDKVAHV